MSGFVLYVAPDGGLCGGVSGLEGHDFLAQLAKLPPTIGRPVPMHHAPPPPLPGAQRPPPRSARDHQQEAGRIVLPGQLTPPPQEPTHVHGPECHHHHH